MTEAERQKQEALKLTGALGVAGERKAGRPWWDTAGSKFQSLLNSFSPIIGR